MLGGNQPQGFTIIEVIIFLGVSGLLFLSVLGLISNKQNTTEWDNGIHQAFSQLQSLSGDVQNGYYQNGGDFSCSVISNNPPAISYPSASPNGQGSNLGCTFIGHVIQFYPSGQSNQYIVYTVVGRQFASTSSSSTPLLPPSNFNESLPITIGGGVSAVPATVDATTVTLPAGLQIYKVGYIDNSTGVNVTYYDSLIGLFSSFSNTTTSSASTTQLVPIPSNTTSSNFSSALNLTPAQATCFVYEMRDKALPANALYGQHSGSCNSNSANTVINPSGGESICIKSTELSNTYGIITIGGNAGSQAISGGNPLSVQLTSTGSSNCT